MVQFAVVALVVVVVLPSTLDDSRDGHGDQQYRHDDQHDNARKRHTRALQALCPLGAAVPLGPGGGAEERRGALRVAAGQLLVAGPYEHLGGLEIKSRRHGGGEVPGAGGGSVGPATAACEGVVEGLRQAVEKLGAGVDVRGRDGD